MRLTQIKHGVDRWMRAAAAGMALERDAGIDEVERLAPIFQKALRLEVAGAVVDREETLAMLERADVGGHAFLGQQRGEQAVTRRMADVEAAWSWCRNWP